MSPKATDEGAAIRTIASIDEALFSESRPLIRPLRGHLLPLTGEKGCCRVGNFKSRTPGEETMTMLGELNTRFDLHPRRIAQVLALLAALAAPAPADAQARKQAEVLMSEDEEERRFQEQWGYSDAIIAGDAIYLSGVVVGQREGESLETAYDRTYRRIGAILARAGASWDDVVDITTFHTDVTMQMPAIVAIHRRYVTAPFPAWTAINVDRLIPERGITEIKIVARRSSRGAAIGSLPDAKLR